jgi:hypothetical protein
MSVNRIVALNRGYVSNQVNKSVFSSNEKLSAVGADDIFDICRDKNGNIYATDPVANIIVKISSDDKVIVWAGQAGVSGNNGNTIVKREDALFNAPVGIDCDEVGNVYVADSGNNQIRKISTEGRVSVVAGDPDGASGFTNGVAGLLNAPNDVVVQMNNIYIADTGNHAVRFIRSGVRGLSTLCGNGTSGDSTGTYGQLNEPVSLSISKNGHIFINDRGNFKIKKYISDVGLRNFSGTGVRGRVSGKGVPSQYLDLQFIVTEGNEAIYVVDYDQSTGSRLLRVDAGGTAYEIKDFDGRPLGGICTDYSGKLFASITDYADELYVIGNIVIGLAVIQ